MADKKNIGKGHFDITEGSVKHVYVNKKNDALSDISDNEDYLKRKKDLETREFVERRMKMAGPDTFVKRNLAGKIVDKLPGTVGKAVAAGALAGVALEKGINKIKSMEGRDAESEIPSNVEGKSKGGLVRFKKQYQMHNGKF
jgi:hypothetical protein